MQRLLSGKSSPAGHATTSIRGLSRLADSSFFFSERVRIPARQAGGEEVEEVREFGRLLTSLRQFASLLMTVKGAKGEKSVKGEEKEDTGILHLTCPCIAIAR